MFPNFFFSRHRQFGRATGSRYLRPDDFLRLQQFVAFRVEVGLLCRESGDDQGCQNGERDPAADSTLPLSPPAVAHIAHRGNRSTRTRNLQTDQQLLRLVPPAGDQLTGAGDRL